MTGGQGPKNSTPDGRGVGTQLAVLCVDDQEDVLWLTKRYLELNHHEVVFAGETSPHAALDRLEDRNWDCVVSDYRMPRMTGLELLTELRQTHPTLPFLLCTTDREPDIEAEVLQDPHADFTLKRGSTGFADVLQTRIQNLLNATQPRA